MEIHVTRRCSVCVDLAEPVPGPRTVTYRACLYRVIGPINTRIGGHVYPKPIPGDHHREATREPFPSDVEERDALLDGGIERDSVAIISGLSGDEMLESTLGWTTCSMRISNGCSESGSEKHHPIVIQIVR